MSHSLRPQTSYRERQTTFYEALSCLQRERAPRHLPDFLQRERDNIIIVHVWETLFYILNLQIYVYKLWERDNHENWSRTCRALVSPSPLLFFRFPPDSIDKSILSGLVACAELCKNLLLVCRCCKITFPFDSLLLEGVIIRRSHTHEGTCEKRSITPLGDLRAQM
jgi:hypothetical protein